MNCRCGIGAARRAPGCFVGMASCRTGARQRRAVRIPHLRESRWLWKTP